MNVYKRFVSFFSFFIFSVCFSANSNALVIGHYDSTREISGFSIGNLSGATQWLLDNGHTLAPTSRVDDVYLSGVDAFFTGLIRSVDVNEIEAMKGFVNSSGGFLFIQQDYYLSDWHAAGDSILANWGISTSGFHTNDGDNHSVGASSWVTSPNTVSGISGQVHSVVDTMPTNFESLIEDSLDRTVLGVFDAGAGRSSDVLVATDINFWSTNDGWLDVRNRNLWENIWESADYQITGGGTGSGGGTDPSGGGSGSGDNGSGGSGSGGSGGSGSGSGGNTGGVISVDEPAPFTLLALGLMALGFVRFRTS